MADKKGTVLFVDDEPHILNAIRRAITDEAFDGLFAESGAAALKIFEEQEVGVIVTDMRMPVMDGLALLKIVREKYPHTVRIVLSGYTQLSQILGTINHGEIFQFIPKPWQMEEELLWAVRRAIERHNIEAERDKLQVGLAKKNAAYVRILNEMDQKLANERRNIASFKKISHWTCSFWKQHLETCVVSSSDKKHDIDEQIQWVEKIQAMYLGVLPTAYETKELQQIALDLNHACVAQIQLQNELDGRMLLSGYYGLATMVMKSILELHNPDKKMPVYVKGWSHIQNDGMPGVVLESEPSSAVREKQTLLEMGYSLLDTMAQSYNIRLYPRKKDEKIEGVRIEWQLQQQTAPTDGV